MDMMNKKAFLIITLLIFAIFITGCGNTSDNTAPTKPPLHNYLEQKFSQSSGASIGSVTVDNGVINIQLSSLAIGDIKDVAIDVAIVLNRHPEISFSKVNLIYQQTQVSFTKEIFNKYKTGQINDIQFMESLGS